MERGLSSLFFAILIIQLVFYLIAVSFRTDKVTDLAYGGTFVILTIWGYLQSTQTLVHGIVAVCLIVWGLRLAGYLLMRILHMGKDQRFDTMRNNWQSFGKFWLLQTISIWIIFLPSFLIFQSGGHDSTGRLVVGVVLWIGGFLLETIADHQKYTYKKQQPDQRVNTGLWKYSRHPNYLGEMILWWGIFMTAIPLLGGRGWLSLIGPIFIMVLLLFISGIPLLEEQHDKKYGNDKTYIEYKKTTPLLIPRPIRK